MTASGTKAEILEKLGPLLRSAKVLGQVRFTVRDWERDPEAVVSRVAGEGWLREPVIVRSSAAEEDRSGASLAGRFLSVQDVLGAAALRQAVAAVIGSYGRRRGGSDQVFVQPMLRDVALSGVAFNLDPNTGGPYLVVNYDDVSRATDSVTSGRSNQLKTYYGCRLGKASPPGPLKRVGRLVAELESLLGWPSLDIEFALTKAGRLYLLQARRLRVKSERPVASGLHQRALANIRRKLSEMSRPHPGLYGDRNLFGVMPDWNPAEMIGVRPRPLALSLYKEIITDNIWAYQRDNYGYRNLRSFPLMLDFAGLPYVDVRVDFNSFIPKDVPPGLARKLVNYYMARLFETPSHHDKVEFEVVFSCYTLDLPSRLEALKGRGVSRAELGVLAESLRRLTNRIINGETGLWRGDLERIERLKTCRADALDSALDPVSKVYWLIEDCKRYGTLPFAGLARAAFIAVQLLKSLIAVGVIDGREYEDFQASLDTVGSRMARDFRRLGREDFLGRYGHLRPGTYDILSPRYDEEPERYFDWADRARPGPEGRRRAFSLPPRRLRRLDALLQEHRLDHDARGLFDFIRKAIEGREYAKFEFTRSLSDALRIFKGVAEVSGLSADDCSYADIRSISKLYASSADVARTIAADVADGRRRYALTRQIVLPPLMTGPDDVWGFHLPPCQPNFITLKTASGEVAFAEGRRGRLRSSILLIPSADPGYDWVFSRSIAGLITMYGGVNSHMAIRAGELGIPAVIGAGEALYHRWASAQALELDCPNKEVRRLR